MSGIAGTDTTPMMPSQAREFVKQVTEIGRTPFLKGPPGIGKTAIVHQVGKELGLPVVVRLLAQYEPSDFVGLPHIFTDAQGHKRTKFAIPDSFDFTKPSILFLDEFAQADIAVQRAASEIILNHSFGGIPLAPGTRVVAASNRKQDRAGAGEILSHNKSRMVTVQMDISAQEWSSWALTNGIHQTVIGYIMNKGKGSLLNVDHKADAYPCPRTWEAVSAALDGLAAGKVTRSVLPSIIAGSVGHAEAATFISFMESYEERPTIDEILNKPDTAKVPSKQDDQQQVAYMIMSNGEMIEGRGLIREASEYMKRLGRDAVGAAARRILKEATASGDGRKSQIMNKFISHVDGN